MPSEAPATTEATPEQRTPTLVEIVAALAAGAGWLWLWNESTLAAWLLRVGLLLLVLGALWRHVGLEARRAPVLSVLIGVWLALPAVAAATTSWAPEASLQEFALRACTVALCLAASVGLRTRLGAGIAAAGAIAGPCVCAVLGIADCIGGTGQPSYWGGWLRDFIPARAAGPLDAPHLLAGHLLVGMVLAVWIWRRSPAAPVKTLSIAAVVVMAAALSLTQSRAALGAAVIGGLAALAMGPRRWRRIPAGVLACAVFVGLQPSVLGGIGTYVRNDGSLAHRRFIWATASEMWRRHPIMGVGAGAFRAAFSAHRPRNWFEPPALVHAVESAHSDCLHVVAEGGIVGALVVAAGLAAAGVCYRQRVAVNPDAQWAAAALIVTWLVHSSMHGLFTSPSYIGSVAVGLVLVGMSSGSRATQPRRRRSTLTSLSLGAVICAALVVGVSGCAGEFARRRVLALAENGRLRAARQAALLWKSVAPLSEDARLYLARLDGLSADDAGGEALRWYRQAARLAPGDAVPHYELAALLEWRMPGEAIEHCRRAVELDPYNPTYRTSLGLLLVRRRDYVNGELQLRRGVLLWKLAAGALGKRDDGQAGLCAHNARLAAYARAVALGRSGRLLAAQRAYDEASSLAF